MEQVVLPCGGMNQDIVQIGSIEGSVGPEIEVHDASVEAKGQDLILPMAPGGGEGGFGLSTWG